MKFKLNVVDESADTLVEALGLKAERVDEGDQNLFDAISNIESPNTAQILQAAVESGDTFEEIILRVFTLGCAAESLDREGRG